MLKRVRLHQDRPIPSELKRLYEANFPIEERIPWPRLLESLDHTRCIDCYYEAEELIGMTYLFFFETYIYLGYLVVEESKQSHGYGGEILELLKQHYKDKTILIDVERLEEEAPNYEERKRRVQFYKNHGFEKLSFHYYFFEVDYDLYSYNGTVKQSDFKRLLFAHSGPVAKNAVLYNEESVKEDET